MPAPPVEGPSCFYNKSEVLSHFQKSSDFFDLQQVIKGWLSGIGSASVRGKKCMRLFCKKAQEEVSLKCIVEFFVLWQPGILISVTEIKLTFYS